MPSSTQFRVRRWFHHFMSVLNRVYRLCPSVAKKLFSRIFVSPAHFVVKPSAFRFRSPSPKSLNSPMNSHLLPSIFALFLVSPPILIKCATGREEPFSSGFTVAQIPILPEPLRPPRPLREEICRSYGACYFLCPAFLQIFQPYGLCGFLLRFLRGLRAKCSPRFNVSTVQRFNAFAFRPRLNRSREFEILQWCLF
jgi:hypothetical protein